MSNEKTLIVFDSQGMQRTITRMASEIIENYNGIYDLVLIGLKTRGEFLANRLYDEIKKIDNINIEKGVIDITLYRDDYRTNLKIPHFNLEDLPFSIDNKKVILVDDVLFTGRSVHAAMNAIMDLGRPKIIEFASLIDRGHRELPISSNYTGKYVSTLLGQDVSVKMREIDGDDVVTLIS